MKSPEKQLARRPHGPRRRAEGTGKAAAAFTIEDADLVTLAKDPQKAQDLSSTASCASTATSRLAQKLGFLKDLGYLNGR